MIWICDLRVIGDDVEVNIDLDLQDFFGTTDLALEEHNDTRDREMRYFLLRKTSNRQCFDVTVSGNNAFTVLGINQPGRDMNLMPRFVATQSGPDLIFFELHSGFLYPLIDGALNLPADIRSQLINNGLRFLEEKQQIFDEFHDRFVQQGFLSQEQSPSLLLFNTHYVDYHYLSRVRLKPQQIDLLNQQGLNVYISEPILEDNVESSLVYEPNVLHLLNDLASNNGLIRVTVHLCEHGFPNPNRLYPRLNLVCHDIFMRMSSFEYATNGYPCLDAVPTKKFWSGNWIYKPHRHIIASHLVGRSANMSWHYSMKKSYFEEVFYVDKVFYKENQRFIEFLEQADPDLLQNLLTKANDLDSRVPIKMDNDVLLKNNVNDYTIQNRSSNGYSHSLSRFYADSFCGIVTETVFDYPYPVLSEKTLCCMINQRPLILVAPSGSLAYLKKLGFQTFDRWWDESYDQESSHNERMLKILRVIDDIDCYDMDHLTTLLRDMQPVLAHNRELALKIYRQHQTL